MAKDYIIEKLRGIDMLPVFPRVAGEMMGIMKDPSSSASDLAKHMDPSTVGEVLRIANTAFSGTRNFRSVTCLEHAIAVIGFDRLSESVLRMPFISTTGEERGTFDGGGYITHSIMCGLAAKGISSAAHAGNPDELYLCGLMHDIGALILYRYFGDEWQAINRLTASGMPRIEAERAVLSVDHGHIGADLLELWDTPGAVTDAVRYHHRPDQTDENGENVRIVHLANKLAKSVNLREDLETFDEFSARHRTLLESAAAAARDFPPSEEVTFLEIIFDLLKEAKHYLEDVVKDNHDKSSCS